GRIALYLTDHLPLLHRPRETTPDGAGANVLAYLRQHGASFFAQLQLELGGFPAELVDALWDLVWQGLITNDTFHALRAHTRSATKRAPSRPSGGARFRSRRVA